MRRSGNGRVCLLEKRGWIRRVAGDLVAVNAHTQAWFIGNIKQAVGVERKRLLKNPVDIGTAADKLDKVAIWEG